MKVQLFVVGLVIAVMVFLAGCQAQQASPTAAPAAPTSAPAAKPTTASTAQAAANTAAATTSAAPASTATAETFKVGIVQALTGPVSDNAIKGQKTMQMAIDDWNARGGVKIGGKTYLAQSVVGDDRFSSEGALEACNRLVLNEKVKIIVGVSDSGPLATCQPVAESAKALIVTLGSGTPANFGPAHSLTFSAGTSLQLPRNAALINWLTKTYPQAKRLVYLAADNGSGHNEVNLADPLAKDAGLTLVPVYFPTDTKDFSAVITRVLAQKPDAIVLQSGTAASVAQFLAITKALGEQNWKGPYLGAYANIGMGQGGAAAEGFVFPILMDYNSPVLPQVGKDLSNRFIQKYGRDAYAESQFLNQYNSPWVALQAIAQAGTVDDTTKIAETLRAGQWDTTYGKLAFGGAKTFGLKSALEVPIFLGKVQGGKPVTFQVVPGTIP